MRQVILTVSRKPGGTIKVLLGENGLTDQRFPVVEYQVISHEQSFSQQKQQHNKKITK